MFIVSRSRHRLATRSKNASALFVVLWLLVACSAIVFAAQREAIEAHRTAHSRFERECARWAARGGVSYAVAHLASFAEEPCKALLDKPDPDFRQLHKDSRPVGWFLAPRPNPSDETDSKQSGFRIQSEQARINLNAVPATALPFLFASEAQRQAFQAECERRFQLASERQPAPAGATTPDKTRELPCLFGHPFELIASRALGLGVTLGQDWNDNSLLDPHEIARHEPGPPAARAASGLKVDRGLADLVTTWTDGKLDAYETDPALLTAVLAEFPGATQAVQTARAARPALETLALGEKWAPFCKKHLTHQSTYFRLQAFGTIRGHPVARVSAVVQFPKAAKAEDEPSSGGERADAEPSVKLHCWRSEG